MKKLFIKYQTQDHKLYRLTVLVELDFYKDMFQNGSEKQKCEYARWLISKSGWFTIGNIPKNHIKSFEIEGFILLEFGNSKWKDGITLEYISD